MLIMLLLSLLFLSFFGILFIFLRPDVLIFVPQCTTYICDLLILLIIWMVIFVFFAIDVENVFFDDPLLSLKSERVDCSFLILLLACEICSLECVFQLGDVKLRGSFLQSLVLQIVYQGVATLACLRSLFRLFGLSRYTVS